MVVCAADPWVFLPVSPGRRYIAHRTGVCERGRRKYCVTHSRTMFRMVEYIVNPVGTGLPF